MPASGMSCHTQKYQQPITYKENKPPKFYNHRRTIKTTQDKIAHTKSNQTTHRRPALDVLGAVTMHNMSIEPSSNSTALLAAHLSIQVLSPLGSDSPLAVRAFAMPNGQLLYNSRRVASLSIDDSVVSSNGDGSVSVRLTSLLQVEADAFAAFLVDMLNSEAVILKLAGMLC
jgi:hypothetical protein